MTALCFAFSTSAITFSLCFLWKAINCVRWIWSLLRRKMLFHHDLVFDYVSSYYSKLFITQLLNGYTLSTHSHGISDFRNLFPTLFFFHNILSVIVFLLTKNPVLTKRKLFQAIIKFSYVLCFNIKRYVVIAIFIYQFWFLH